MPLSPASRQTFINRLCDAFCERHGRRLWGKHEPSRQATAFLAGLNSLAPTCGHIAPSLRRLAFWAAASPAWEFGVRSVSEGADPVVSSEGVDTFFVCLLFEFHTRSVRRRVPSSPAYPDLRGRAYGKFP